MFSERLSFRLRHWHRQGMDFWFVCVLIKTLNIVQPVLWMIRTIKKLFGAQMMGAYNFNRVTPPQHIENWLSTEQLTEQQLTQITWIIKHWKITLLALEIHIKDGVIITALDPFYYSRLSKRPSALHIQPFRQFKRPTHSDCAICGMEWQ